jgi:TRAP-type C4-dicarboxylate transport system permease small subunit
MTSTILQVRRYVEGFCAVLAGLGFFLFIGEALLSAVSIIGRTTIDKGVQGDYELVQMITAIAIAMCLPYCEFKRGHVFVDFFTLWAPKSVTRFLDAFAALLLAAVAFLLAWRTYVGLQEIREYAEATMVLSIPIWWTYIALPICFILLGIAALFNFHSECTKRDS